MYGQTQKITGVFFKLRRPAFPWGPLKLRTSSPIMYKHQLIGNRIWTCPNNYNAREKQKCRWDR